MKNTILALALTVSAPFAFAQTNLSVCEYLEAQMASGRSAISVLQALPASALGRLDRAETEAVAHLLVASGNRMAALDVVPKLNGGMLAMISDQGMNELLSFFKDTKKDDESGSSRVTHWQIAFLDKVDKSFFIPNSNVISALLGECLNTLCPKDVYGMKRTAVLNGEVPMAVFTKDRVTVDKYTTETVDKKKRETWNLRRQFELDMQERQRVRFM